MDALQSKTVYVAGHRGLVGSAMARALRDYASWRLLVRERAELDLREQAAVEAFMQRERPHVVVLAAALVGGIHANATRPGEFIHDNLAIATNVLHAARICGVERLLFLGSSCIYPRLAPQPMREEHLLTGPLEPTNRAYAVAKIAGIETCRAYNAQYNTAFLPVMPTNLYGPGDNFDLLGSHVIPALIRKFHLAKLATQGDHAGIERDRVLFGEVPPELAGQLGLCGDGEPVVWVWGTGSPRREFMHVDDMAAACLHLLLQTDEQELTNIGTGMEVSIAELVEVVREQVFATARVAYATDRPDGAPRKLLDISRLHATGWRPSIGLHQGIADAYNWYLEQLHATPE